MDSFIIASAISAHICALVFGAAISTDKAGTTGLALSLFAISVFGVIWTWAEVGLTLWGWS